ncbi:MAG TPA: alpha/beta hydrolase, partial [Rudaea sp.]|nr:alpha/beta hydrolase [Rudaea sp.]
DPCFTALLADKRSELRPPPPHVTLADMRAGNKAYLAATPKVPLHSVVDHVIEGPAGPLRVRVYRPSADIDLPATLFCHGGGFVLGDLDTHDSICHQLAHSSGHVVVAVDYRLAPETRFPGAIEDCYTALAWLTAETTPLGIDVNRLTVCGDSAGANLAFAIALLARERGPTLKHIALLYPTVDPSANTESMREFGRGYMLSSAAVQWTWGLYLSSPADASHPLVALLHADLTGLPPVSLSTAEFDPLRDEGEALGRKLSAAGIPVVVRRYAGMIHGFAGLAHLTPCARQAIEDIAADMKTFGV